MYLKRFANLLAVMALALLVCPALALANDDPTYSYGNATWSYKADTASHTVTITGCQTSENDVTVPDEIDGNAVTALALGSTTQDWDVLPCKKLTLPRTLATPATTAAAEALADALNCFYNASEYAISGGDNAAFAIRDGVLMDAAKTKVVNFPDAKTSANLRSGSGYSDVGDGEVIVGGGADDDGAITTIGIDAFGNCDAITYVDLLVSVVEVEEGAFFNMESLVTLGVSNVDATLGSNAVGNNAATFVLVCEEGSLAQGWAASQTPRVRYRFPEAEPLGYAIFALSPSAMPEQDYDSHPLYSYTTYGYIDMTDWGNKGEFTKLTEGEDYAVIPESDTEEEGAGSYLVHIVGIGGWGGVVDMYYDIVGPGSWKGTMFTAGAKLNAAYYKATSATAATYSAPVYSNYTQFSVPATIESGHKVTALAASAFKDSKASKVTLGGNLKAIGKSAFKGAAKLKALAVPKKVATIGASAFSGAKKLKTLTVKSTKLTKAGVKNCLKGSSVTVVKVPKAKLKAYTQYFKKANSGKKVKVKAA